MRIIFWLIKLVLGLLLLALAALAILYVVLTYLMKPSNDRDWTVDQAVLPYAEINQNLVSVHNVRNFSYASTTSYTPAYYDKTYDLNTIKNVYYIVEPFSGFRGSAHTFLSFEFEGATSTTGTSTSDFVAISIEIRKEKGESFSAVKGLLNQYEIMYVIADERDVVKLRSNYRKDLVYVYPVNTTQEKMQALFLDMINRANELKAKPEFYNSVTNNCTINIAEHVKTISPGRLPWWNLTYLLPENSDKLAYDLSLIKTDLSFEATREKFLINERAMKFADDPNFSIKIRE